MPRDDEADVLMKQAKAHHTKSITKWSSDWDSAADCYQKAAQQYTFMQNVPKAREAWDMAAHAHEKAKNPYLAAKCVDSLANFLKDQSSYAKSEEGAKEISNLYIRASHMYALDQKPDRQAEALSKAARLAPAGDARGAAKLILQGLDALEDSDKHHMTLDLYRSVILLQVRGNLLLDAVETLKREIKTFERLQQPAAAAKAGLEIVILCLSMGDWVLAEREFQQMSSQFGFGHTKEQSAAYGLISAIEERDEEALAASAKDSALQFIIPEIQRLAKKLTISMSNAPAKKKQPTAASTPLATTSSPTRPSAAAPPAKEASEDDEDDEEDLR
mmetsp:Transcript_30524/g.35269  ORF Transcript_30524/g.35269 Transcript_30524/m.35269 type:complete len:331 (+) Transcript_30524:23-1015(+)